MSTALKDLLALLHLDQIEENVFRGQSQNLGLPQVYGGQVMGQALSAAKETVAHDRFLHSFHSYFLTAGDPEHPIFYDVETLREGPSFSTRRIKALQFDAPIFYLTASYHKHEPGFEHQCEMPQVPGPENFISESALVDKYKHLIPKFIADTFGGERPIEVRPMYPVNPLDPQISDAKQFLWIKANGKMEDDICVHQSLLAYASDWGFLPTAMQPYGVTMMTPRFKAASIDHSMWFHREFRMDEWLLHAIESPIAHGARGLVRGQIFNQRGELVASTMQEGLMRQMRKKR